tara:strand:- start:49 stop:813 length:765 start_codon:yes stop_codon:yes gene_type:complete
MVVVFFIILILLILLVLLVLSYKATRPIVVSMTTIPERITSHKIHKTINSILEQSYPVERFYINIPYKTMKNKPYPEDMIDTLIQQYPSVIFNRVENDLGPITKLVPTLSHVHVGEWIALIDDDTVYNKDMITNLVDSDGDAVGYAGRLKDGLSYITSENVQQGTECEFLETFAGVLYKAELFDDFKTDTDSTCVNQDDIVIGRHLERQGVKRFVIQSRFQCNHDGSGTPELRDENLGDGNKKCYDTLFKKNST